MLTPPPSHAAADGADGRRPFVWLASYLKSGNTWTRLLLANFLADSEQAVDINDLWEALPGISPCDRDWFDRATGLPSSDCTDDEVEPLRPAALRAHAAAAAGGRQFCRVHDALHDTAAGEPLFPADVSAGAVYLVRNPLDVAVSLAFHFGGEDFSEAVTRMNDRRFVLGSGWELLRRRLLDWSGHVESWRSAPFPVLVVRYEDLLADTVGQLARMTRFLGLAGAADGGRRLRRAAAASAFSRLQEQEARHGFQGRDRRCRRFFRSGRSGDWRRYLSAAQAQRIARRHGAVMRACGYDPREAEAVSYLRGHADARKDGE